MDQPLTKTASGLGYVDLVEGTGPQPKPGESVRVHYTGWLENGKEFGHGSCYNVLHCGDSLAGLKLSNTSTVSSVYRLGIVRFHKNYS